MLLEVIHLPHSLTVVVLLLVVHQLRCFLLQLQWWLVLLQ
jgi:hypothetical protein